MPDTRAASPAWSNRDVVLYHGTTLAAAQAILTDGIDIQSRRRTTDFGTGFYTTTIRTQASAWARKRAAQRPMDSIAAMVVLTLPRGDLAQLRFIAYVVATASANDFWELVRHCRSGQYDLLARNAYDVAIGPVSQDWRTRIAFPDSEQISFHTRSAANMLNSSARKRIIQL